ncbi:hypothetical protein E2C01_032209 [Portunus trituberculatus]|uniref:Uncharacterized protein n=1 Tax=Portunus trituberculatus TaxID=210409 RepID=A0A5B7EZQ7_PORTR|nr:hypothetical protein [Portunus trituberculatus]
MMARQVDKVAMIGLEASQSQCCKRGIGGGVFKLPKLLLAREQSRPAPFPSGPVTCCWPVPTLGVYPALLFLRRTVWSSGDPVPAS